MLSILIPTYNYNIVSLVNELHKQCVECNIKFEIICIDDGSNSAINIENEKINYLSNCKFKELSDNIGRSAIRNLLAKKAKHNNLLFLDADVFPLKRTFIKEYLILSDPLLIVGGLSQTKTPSKAPSKLRWIYTKKRESKTLCSSNFLIKKEVFKLYSFDESLKKYGYEDLVFFNSLINNNIKIEKTKNPVIHYGNDPANIFIKKTEFALENLIELIESKKINTNQVKIAKYYFLLKKFKIQNLVLCIFDKTKGLLLKNFESNHPSILLFDFYRLGYFCLLKNKK